MKFRASLAAAAVIAAMLATPAAADPWGRWGGRGGGWGPHRHGGDWGGAVAAAAIGGLAVGAIAASAAAAPAYRECYPSEQPILDQWGEVVAYRRVQVCQ